jgi:hypothetical protein
MALNIAENGPVVSVQPSVLGWVCMENSRRRVLRSALGVPKRTAQWPNARVMRENAPKNTKATAQTMGSRGDARTVGWLGKR